MKCVKLDKSSLIKIYGLFLLLICLLNCVLNKEQKTEQPDLIIIKKTLPFISYLMKDPDVLKIVKKDKVLYALTLKHKVRMELAINQCKDAGCYADALNWTPEEIIIVGDSLAGLANKSESFREIISKLKDTGYYNLYASYPDDKFVRAVWNNVASGVGHALDIYVRGNKPFYAAIDSISFGPEDEGFREKIKGLLSDELTDMENRVFFEVPVNIAIKALLLNKRDEAARYEPLDSGMNINAFKKIRNIKWDKYKYSMILVPGQGPEKDGVAIDPMGINRCRMAEEYFKNGAAPFIVVSGGHVHPNKTPFCEAVEMKKYMVKEFNIPEDAIFIEPHARHTTTNMRNTARMIYRFGIPADKKILIVTDPVQNAFLVGMEKRFMTELGCVPYRELKKLSETTSEYYPDRNALQCNPMDPLDP